MASKMEIEACNISIDNADLVLMDGSLYSQFMTRQTSLTQLMIESIKKETMLFLFQKHLTHESSLRI